MESIPEEILLDIFMRLFAKQLAQMRSVSKSWNALLSQSSFIKSHLSHSKHKKDQILLVFHQYEESISDFKPFTALCCRPPHLELTNLIKLPVNPKRPEHTNDIKVIGSVNGLICSSYGDSVIQIWNPSLSAVLTLPPHSLPSGDNQSVKTYLRFGFDLKKDDYKVVKLTGLTASPYRYSIKCWLQVELYGMKKGTWQLITERFPSHITHIMDGYSVCADDHGGHLHWVGLYITGKSYSKTIVAFEFGSETFCEIPLPHSTLNHNHTNELGVLSGKLCTITWVEDGPCEVWVMEEYGVAESWVKRHVFSQFIGDIYPFGFTSLAQFLIRYNDYLVLYDPVAIKQKVLEDYCLAHRLVEYADSLVWVAPAEHEMVDGGRQY